MSLYFGLTPEQFGENLRDNYQRHETEQHATEPLEAAQEFISKYTEIYFHLLKKKKIWQNHCHYQR